VKHLKRTSRPPARAQDDSFQIVGLCENVDNSVQAQLCFLLNVLIGFFVPLAELKSEQDDQTTA